MGGPLMSEATQPVGKWCEIGREDCAGRGLATGQRTDDGRRIGVEAGAFPVTQHLQNTWSQPMEVACYPVSLLSG